MERKTKGFPKRPQFESLPPFCHVPIFSPEKEMRPRAETDEGRVVSHREFVKVKKEKIGNTERS